MKRQYALRSVLLGHGWVADNGPKGGSFQPHSHGLCVSTTFLNLWGKRLPHCYPVGQRWQRWSHVGSEVWIALVLEESIYFSKENGAPRS